MNKKLIQQLLDDSDTRLEIAIAIGQAVDANDDRLLYDDLMINALNELNDTLVQGDMVTIEVSDHMWVRGEYVRTRDDGKVEVLSAFGKPYTGTVPYKGKRVDLVIKDHKEKNDMNNDKTGGAAFSVADMLDNAACAAQHLPLDDDKVVRGAVVRSFAQWLKLNPKLSIDDAILILENSKEAKGG